MFRYRISQPGALSSKLLSDFSNRNANTTVSAYQKWSSYRRRILMIAHRLQRGVGRRKRISYLSGRYSPMYGPSRTELSRVASSMSYEWELRERARQQLGHSSGSGPLTLPLAAAISRTLQIEWRLLDTRLIPLKTSNGQKLHQQPPSILRAAVLTCLHGSPVAHAPTRVHVHTHTSVRLSSVFVSGSRQFAPMFSRSLSPCLSSLSLFLSISLSVSRLVKPARSALNATGGGNFYPFSMGVLLGSCKRKRWWKIFPTTVDRLWSSWASVKTLCGTTIAVIGTTVDSNTLSDFVHVNSRFQIIVILIILLKFF